MAKRKAPVSATEHAPQDNDSYGVLVGWTHAEFNGRIDLRLQLAQSTSALQQGEVENHHIVMTANQATLLANYLFKVTEQSAPTPRKRGALSRWFGS